MADLMALGRDRPTVVVLDDFPYLLGHYPELDSIIQRHYDPGRASYTGTQMRQILCGSAVSVMSQLPNGPAPQRGREGLNLPMKPFDLRVSRELHESADLTISPVRSRHERRSGPALLTSGCCCLGRTWATRYESTRRGPRMSSQWISSGRTTETDNATLDV